MSRILPPRVMVGFFLFSAAAWPQVNACDLVTPFGTVDQADVTAATNMALNPSTCPSTINIAGLGVCNVVMVQRVINAAAGQPCVTPTTHGVSLSWVASTSSNLKGYNVYRGTVSGGPYTKVNSTVVTTLTYSDSSVQAGQTYYYVVTAVDNSNNESAYSTPPCLASIPTP